MKKIEENLYDSYKIYTDIISLQLYFNKTFSSTESESEYFDDYEVEVEQFDVGSILRHRGKAS